MLLTQLSSSELREILRYLNTGNLCKLLICGCNILSNKLLSELGVENVDFAMKPTPRSLPWPQLVSWMTQLRSFTLREKVSRKTPLITAQHLLSLSKKLKTLCIDHTPGCVSAFAETLLLDPPHFQHLTSLRLLSLQDSAALNIENVKWPSTLLSLHLGDLSHSQLDLRLLPISLTQLIGRFKCLSPLPEEHTFPSTLQSLTLELAYSFSLDDLKRLSASSSLLHLTINMPPRYKQVHREPPLPKLAAPPASIIPLLPRSLETLELLLSEQSPVFVPLHDALPKLRTVRGILPFRLFGPHFSKLPSSLTSFQSTVPLDQINALSERWPCFINNSITDINGLPVVKGGIRKLRIGAQLFARNDQTNYPITIPPSVTVLRIDTVILNDRGRYSVEGPLVLPAGLTHLKVRDGYSTPIVSLKRGLPPFLKVFINEEGFVGGPEALSLLPRSLTILRAGNIARESSYPPFYDIESSTFLPPTLTELVLGPLAISSVGWINGLPHTLTHLTLNIWPQNDRKDTFIDFKSDIGDGALHTDVVKFPPNLVQLHLSLGRSILNVSYLIPMLPEKLMTFILSHRSSTALVDEDMKFLPRSLVHLRLNDASLTSACKDDLPATLRQFSVAGRIPNWFLSE